MRRGFKRLGYAAMVTFSVGCAETCAAPEVAMGVARLTTLNADALVNALNNDTTCGFASTAVLLAAKQDLTKIGKIGAFTLTVTDCQLDFGAAGLETSKNCSAKATRAFGKAKVSGTKTITGHLTTNLLSPVIPEGPDSVVITLDATFDNFRAAKDGGKATMTWVSGGLSGTMNPRLGVSSDTGACAIQTTNTAFSNVVYKATKAVLKSEDDEIEVDIDGSMLEGQYGLGPSGENTIKGTMKIWGEEHKLPIEDDARGLDPDYKAAQFVADFQCKDKLLSPVSYACDLAPTLAQNAARGLVKVVATATSLLDANTECGFKAAAVFVGRTQQGTNGGPGSVTFTSTACTVGFPIEVTLPQNCVGSSSVVKGTATATATKVVSGYLTGSPTSPVVPLTRTSTVFTYSSLVFDGFKAWDKATSTSTETTSFTFSGAVSAVFKPVAGESTDPSPIPPFGPLYSIATPVFGIEDVVTATGTLTLFSGGNRFVIDVASANIDAFNGSSAGVSNSISGAITADAKAFTALPEATLSPTFTQSGFDASYVCTPKLKEPVPPN